jgi:hypothetical protein
MRFLWLGGLGVAVLAALALLVLPVGAAFVVAVVSLLAGLVLFFIGFLAVAGERPAAPDGVPDQKATPGGFINRGSETKLLLPLVGFCALLLGLLFFGPVQREEGEPTVFRYSIPVIVLTHLISGAVLVVSAVFLVILVRQYGWRRIFLTDPEKANPDGESPARLAWFRILGMILGAGGIVMGGQFCDSLAVDAHSFTLEHRYWAWSAGRDSVPLASLGSINFRSVRDGPRARSRFVMTCTVHGGGGRDFEMTSLLSAAVPDILRAARQQGIAVNNAP